MRRTNGRRDFFFLKTDGMYGNFAGRDASRGMAKQSFDLGASPTLYAICASAISDWMAVRYVDAHRRASRQARGSYSRGDVSLIFRHPFVCVNADIARLCNSENMKGWIEHFSNKYIICGRLVENDAAI